MAFARLRLGGMGRNLLILATCQGLLFSINTAFVMVSGLVGAALAPDPSLATVPLGLFVTGAALSTYPASLLMGRVGRRLGFLIGAAVGFYGGVLGAWSVAAGSFELLCFTGLFMGVYFAFGQYYRFAIADVATGTFRRHAVSIVLAGGVFSGILGPHSADWSRDLLAPWIFMGTYAVVSALAYVKFLLLVFIDIPMPPRAARRRAGRPLGEIVRQPRFVVAAVAGMVSWAAMNQLMMGAPIAMRICSLPFSDTAFVMQWHNFAMFLPGFAAGALINRYGVHNVMLWGALMMFGSVAAVVSGIDLWNFWWGRFPGRYGLVFPVRGRDDTDYRMLHRPGAVQNPGIQRFPGFRRPGRRRFFVRRSHLSGRVGVRRLHVAAHHPVDGGRHDLAGFPGGGRIAVPPRARFGPRGHAVQRRADCACSIRRIAGGAVSGLCVRRQGGYSGGRRILTLRCRSW